MSRPVLGMLGGLAVLVCSHAVAACVPPVLAAAAGSQGGCSPQRELLSARASQRDLPCWTSAHRLTSSASTALRRRACSLPHGAEGGFALPYATTGVTCTAARPVVKDVSYSGGPCMGSNLTGSGCHAAHGFLCRIPSPTTPGFASPGDRAICTRGNKRITFELPG
jgi:hypothetical protein